MLTRHRLAPGAGAALADALLGPSRDGSEFAEGFSESSNPY